MGRRLQQLITGVRWGWIKFRYRVDFARPHHIGKGFQIQMCPDGYPLCGRFACQAGSRFSDGVIVAPYGGSIEIGRDFFCGPYTVLYGHGGLHIGSRVMIAGHSMLIPADHDFDDPAKPIVTQGETRRGIAIGDDVWLGCGVRILDGVEIGDGAVIAAGAVVVRDVPKCAVAAGVPARVIKLRGARSER